MLDVAEFDRFADEYTQLHKHNIRISGEQPDYFARYKIEILRRRWTRDGLAEPCAILDFGCGVGASLGHLVEQFPGATVTGLDISERSLAIAAQRAPDRVELRRYDGAHIGLARASQDLIFSACVFHHIEPVERLALVRQLRALLRPGGALVIFEHNPLNPVTRYIVATCPFDENAVLASSKELIKLQHDAGFQHVDAQFTGFFPARLSRLRPLEPLLARLPLGAQYYTLAEA